MSNPRTASARLAAVAGVAVLALTGCGAIHTGTAVEVGEESISVSRLDQVAADFCAAVEPQLDGQAETIPNGFFRGGIAGTLTLRSIAEQLAEDYGVSATDSERYQEALGNLRVNVAAVPEDLRESVVEIESTAPYVEAVQAAVGEQLLEGEGAHEDFVAAGAEAFETWIAEHDVEFAPGLNTTLENGQIATADGALSFAVSEAAKTGLEERPNPAMARTLPDTHRCGR